ncbi:histidine phosphatase family protein [Paenibacillus sp. HJGM_3]|uniref:histidine phosphatase family protein n=1 Tax=Paenibacillus sp. HJGM_3 TaxID=3379816 RepID=UPI00385A1E4B
MKELYVVRHGEAEHLLTGTVGGWTNTSLTDLGREQARNTGKRLRKFLGGRAINYYSSDLSRARETAEIIADEILSSPTISDHLRELNNGIAANKSKEEAEKLMLPLTEPAIDWVPYPEAESWNMMRMRINNFMDRILNDKHDTTLIVSHANSGISIIHWWLEFPEEVISRVSFKVAPCSISHLIINSWGEKTISKLNDTCHLETCG